MSKESERKREKQKEKLGYVCFLVFLWGILFFFKYDFENYLWNGLLLFATSFSIAELFLISAYYIETGFKPENKKHHEDFKTFNLMHPWITLYNKILISLVFMLYLISSVLVIKGVILYFG